MAQRTSILAVLYLCFWVSSGSAQGTTGSVSGTVRDQQGAVVPGATVRAVNEENGNLDFSAEKGFQIRENLRAVSGGILQWNEPGQLRAANTHLFSGDFLSPLAGVIINTVTPARQIQFGLKLLF